MTAPVLVFGWGNPSRGDDALGPQFVEALQMQAAQHPEWGEVDFLTDFQLQVEHALDLQGRQCVLFVDAHLALAEACSLAPVVAGKDASFTTHMLSPQALLHVWDELNDEPAPPCHLLCLRAASVELGDGLSTVAQNSLRQGLLVAAQWLAAQRNFSSNK